MAFNCRHIGVHQQQRECFCIILVSHCRHRIAATNLLCAISFTLSINRFAVFFSSARIKYNTRSKQKIKSIKQNKSMDQYVARATAAYGDFSVCTYHSLLFQIVFHSIIVHIDRLIGYTIRFSFFFLAVVVRFVCLFGDFC